MTRHTAMWAWLAAHLVAPLASAALPVGPLTAPPLRASLTAPIANLSHPALIRQAASQGASPQSAYPATRSASTLPPTQPTALKPGTTSAASSLSPARLSPTPPPALLAQAAAPKSLTPKQVRSQLAPPDAAPLRPPAPTAQAAPARAQNRTAGAPSPQPAAAKQSASLPPSQAAPPASTRSDAAAPTGAAPAATPQQTLTSPGSASLPPKVTNLPPGPLTSLPVSITTSPNEVRISGLGTSSAPWSIVLLLTLLSVIPAILICVTPFARLLVVFHFLRQALGLQTTPSNQTLIGLTLILTFFIMEPVGKQIYQQALVPLQDGKITAFDAIARGKGPMRDFMVPFVREKDAALFLEIAKAPRPRDIHDLSMRILVPAYIVSELKAGFQIGAVLFLPFLVVDMVVASITTSVGMMQLPPVVISTPLKLFLFLMVDGWHLLIGALVRSFS